MSNKIKFILASKKTPDFDEIYYYFDDEGVFTDDEKMLLAAYAGGFAYKHVLEHEKEEKIVNAVTFYSTVLFFAMKEPHKIKFVKMTKEFLAGLNISGKDINYKEDKEYNIFLGIDDKFNLYSKGAAFFWVCAVLLFYYYMCDRDEMLSDTEDFRFYASQIGYANNFYLEAERYGGTLEGFFNICKKTDSYMGGNHERDSES